MIISEKNVFIVIYIISAGILLHPPFMICLKISIQKVSSFLVHFSFLFVGMITLKSMSTCFISINLPIGFNTCKSVALLNFFLQDLSARQVNFDAFSTRFPLTVNIETTVGKFFVTKSLNNCL